MAGLCDLVEILENNMECVVLEVKDGVQKELVCLGCFDGDETMLRLTKGDDHTCTIFFGAGKSCSWEWGMSGHTLVSDSLKKCGRMIESNRQIIMRSDKKLPQPFASWSNSL